MKSVIILIALMTFCSSAKSVEENDQKHIVYSSKTHHNHKGEVDPIVKRIYHGKTHVPLENDDSVNYLRRVGDGENKKMYFNVKQRGHQKPLEDFDFIISPRQPNAYYAQPENFDRIVALPLIMPEVSHNKPCPYGQKRDMFGRCRRTWGDDDSDWN